MMEVEAGQSRDSTQMYYYSNKHFVIVVDSLVQNVTQPLQYPEFYGTFAQHKSRNCYDNITTSTNSCLGPIRLL